MRQGHGSFISWIMNNFSSFYRHLLTIAIVGLGYVVLGWVVLTDMNVQLRYIKVELVGLKHQEKLRDFLIGINTHKYLVQRYYQGNTLLKSQILQLQKEINKDLRNFEKVHFELEEKARGMAFAQVQIFDQGYDPKEVDRKWRPIRANVFDIDLQTSNEQHDELIHNVHSLLKYSDNISNLTQDPSFIIYQMVESSSGLLPNIQESISQSLNIIQMSYLAGELTDGQREELIGLVSLIDRDLRVSEERISRVLTALADDPDIRERISESFASFYQSVSLIVGEIREEVIGQNLEGTSLSTLQSLGIQAINDSFVFWDQVSTGIERILEDREASIIAKRAIIMGVSLFIILIGFILGSYFVSESIKSLKALKETAIKISKGELSARVPVRYKDELGKVCIVFNHMANTLERMMNQFKQLLEGTQTLSRGDFSARIHVDESAEDEIKAVGNSFNRMAESFEEVVTKLHRLVIELTSSATQIAASSKQHEAAILEQGSTTKQISVTATEISATSKDFAQTISDVSEVAEETARLARTGQSNLGKMETVMKQMEDAAANIASRLAVLNEKAGNITTVITTISDVSAQTNLLSLNAAIEAEKAGQAGRSFAVIAREIRGLSDQTAMSTTDIEKIVNEIVDAVKSSVMGVDDFTKEIREGADQVKEVSEQLGRIMEQVKTLVDRFESVDQGMKNQSEAAEQINKALIDLSALASETSESMSQFHSTIKHLNVAAAGLRETLEKIRQ